MLMVAQKRSGQRQNMPPTNPLPRAGQNVGVITRFHGPGRVFPPKYGEHEIEADVLEDCLATLILLDYPSLKEKKQASSFRASGTEAIKI